MIFTTPLDMMMAMQRSWLQTVCQMSQATQDAMSPFARTASGIASRSLVPVRQDTVREETGDQVLQFGEERLEVGVKKVHGETTRVRRVVQNVPVARRVELHDETIIVERRPANGQVADNEALVEREYVVTDTREIPVISKEMHLRELVVVRRERIPRVEIIKETVRRSSAEVIQPTRLPVIIAGQEIAVATDRQEPDKSDGKDRQGDGQHHATHGHGQEQTQSA